METVTRSTESHCPTALACFDYPLSHPKKRAARLGAFTEGPKHLAPQLCIRPNVIKKRLVLKRLIHTETAQGHHCRKPSRGTKAQVSKSDVDVRR